MALPARCHQRRLRRKKREREEERVLLVAVVGREEIARDRR
jgi:hypothetical protein